MTGRKTVLATAVTALRSLGAEVHVVAITQQETDASWLSCPVTPVRPPSLVARGVAGLATLGTRRALNEVLFDSPRVRRGVAAAARAIGADLVVADTVRMWPLAESTGLPVIAHLDDLLSERYAAMTSKTNGDPVLGYYASEIPSGVRPAAEAVARRLLSLEARRNVRREDHIARTAAVTAMTSAADADTLSHRTATTVLALPMAVGLRPPVDPARAAPAEAVFLGGLDYMPNLEALRWWRDQIVPRLQARGTEVRLSAVGFADDDHRREFASTPITLLGYVDDLADALRDRRMFVAPILSGAGVKTKVLDAMSVALPVVATTAGVSGIPVTPGRDALVTDDPERFADEVTSLVDDGERALDVGREGRALLSRTFAPEVVQEHWAQALRAALR